MQLARSPHPALGSVGDRCDIPPMYPSLFFFFGVHPTYVFQMVGIDISCLKS